MCIRLSGDNVVEIRDEAGKGLSREAYARQFLVDEVKAKEASGEGASGAKYYGESPGTEGDVETDGPNSIRFYFAFIFCIHNY